MAWHIASLASMFLCGAFGAAALMQWDHGLADWRPLAVIAGTCFVDFDSGLQRRLSGRGA